MEPSSYYLCVCGRQIAWTDRGATCAACGRSYPVAAMRGATAATLTLDGPDAAVPVLVEQEGDARVGGRLGHFRLLSRISAGGMGVVYRAVDESLERYVAIKVLHQGSESDERIQHLLEEAVAQARINHGNVVHIYYVGRDAGTPFLAMELVEGGTLAQQLEAGGLTFRQTASIGLQLAEAMRQAADLGIVHGDIKPGNVMLDRQQQVKLSDFGLSRFGARDKEGRIAGTPHYMAPEMWDGRTGHASDMYALGVTLFEMTFGQRPLSVPEGASASQIAAAHRNQEVEFPQPWPAHLPLLWRDILERLLAKAPEDRYASYSELLDDLRAAQPTARPAAGRVPRLLAWVVDLAIVWALLNLLGLGMEALPALPVARAMVGVIGCVAILFALLWSSWWGRTPGGKLFQLQVVDRHGLRPSQGRLFLRSGWLLAPIWADWLERTANAVMLLDPRAYEASQRAWAGLALALLLLDFACSWVLTRRRTFHDWVLGTELVLESAEPARSPE